MAVRKILRYGDPVLRQKSKEIVKISKKIQTLAEDMLDTMYINNGVGLAAPQVGELLRMFVIDVSLKAEEFNPIVFINPKIIKKEHAMVCNEGCLSFPEVYTDVRRYKDVLVKAFDTKGKPFVLEANNGELLSRAIQHEFDHLDGILFVDHVRNRFAADAVLTEKGLPPVNPEFILDESAMEDEIALNPDSSEIDNTEENDD